MESLVAILLLSVVFQAHNSLQQDVVLHGGSYQLTSTTCFVSNKFTAACSCPQSFDASCFDAVIYNNTSVQVSNTISVSTTTAITSKFCLCGRNGGLSTEAVLGGGYQQDDFSTSADCRIANAYTSSCSCPSGFQPTSMRSLVFNAGGSLIGSHIYLCFRTSSSRQVGILTSDSSTFSLQSKATTVTVLNNFHGVYMISANQTSLQCLLGNPFPGLRPSRYLSSIGASNCNCPQNACGASLYWITDQLPRSSSNSFAYQRVVICESSMQQPANPSTVKNKVMLGYQKWQQTPKNGFGLEYQHWTLSGVVPMDSSFVDNAAFDVWPDTSEYPASNLTSTSLKRPDGSTTTLYDAFLVSSIDLHLRWLQLYGLDGVWLQRFFSTDSRVVNADLFSAVQVRQISEKYGRTFGVMWDVSGGNDNNLLGLLQVDLARLKNQTIFNSSAYIQHQGKPLVTVWGLGIRDDINVSTATRCIQLLMNSGFAVMGGVKFNWRTTLGANNQNFSSVYNMFDIITPWTVGVYNDAPNFLSFVPAIQNSDASFCTARGQGYAPVVYPGFSWTNLQRHNNAPLNQIRRQGGEFWQTQVDSLELSVVKQASFSHLYLAMYDEFDEGTAITKAAESYLDKPAAGQFLSLDADGFHVPNDHYLCLASRETYRRQQPLAVSFPYTFPS